MSEGTKRRVAIAASSLATVLGLTLLILWIIVFSEESAGDRWGMRPSSAFALLLLGLILLVTLLAPRTRRLPLLLPVLALALLALVTGLIDAGMATGLSLEGMLRWLLPGSGTFVSGPGINSVASLMLLWLSALSLLVGRSRPAFRSYPALLAAILAFLAIVGHLLGTAVFTRVGRYAGMPVDAALGTLLLALALFFSPPLGGVAALFGSRSLAGRVLTLLIPVVAVLPPLTGWLLLQGRRAEFYGAELSTSLFSAIMVLVLAVIISLISVRLERADAERRKADERIQDLNVWLERRAAELSAANKELEAFSYSVSHDLRAPLRALDGFSLALEEDEADNLTETGKSHLRRIRAASQRMGLLIDALLRLSRLSRVEMRWNDVDLTRLAHDRVEMLRSAEPQRRVDLAIEEGLRTTGDEGLLATVIGNLLDNAWKFTRREDTARIEVGSVPRAGGLPAFYVRDNGVGFEMEYSGKLFGAFQRLHADADFEGIGIGLATAQRVIRRHGGEMWAESRPGRGATFYFTVGEAPGAGEAPAAGEARAPGEAAAPRATE